ncbi:nucleotidyltransferase [Sinorhizobium medicae]|uniref:nucleotidyltransferase domain-containing protein n=1 Tax=Sinorhizobium medicae TaxID=110321 RepID=UPI001AAE72DD|nr:nucleotidyltransferase [Sinorhizobium medicae]MBO1963875.1 nucleotidyltransferase [Sinorhizobium medicae]
MAIPEDKFDTWSKQGSVTQSRATYATIRAALEDPTAPYAGRSYDIFLQGSYGNDTNIYADSDVDVVIKTNAVYYYDLEELKPFELEKFNRDRNPATYEYADFKGDVLVQLEKKFGNAVVPGKKAVLVKSNGSRRDADVLPAAQYRRFYAYNSPFDSRYADGIVFWTSDGTKIVNYPKQHSANCTTKHQNTSQWFKPTVRIFKNMRNAMIERGYIANGVAPSYFLEGMLYNVPNATFGMSYGSTFARSLDWLATCDTSTMVCANEQYKLFHPTSPVTWRIERFREFLTQAHRFWENWGRAAA